MLASSLKLMMRQQKVASLLIKNKYKKKARIVEFHLPSVLKGW